MRRSGRIKVKKLQELKECLKPEEDVTIVSSDIVCSICEAEFIEPEDLEAHIKEVHLTTANRHRFCRFCKLILPSLDDFVEHIVFQHYQNLYACQYCYRVFNDDSALRFHEKSHQIIPAKSTYSCSQCASFFKNLNEVEKHEFKEHEDCLEGMMLTPCYLHLASLVNMKAQTFLYSLSRATVYTCTTCSFKTSQSKDYIDHLKKKECRAAVCNSCGNAYTSRKHLYKHLHSKVCPSTIDGNNVVCVTCKKVVTAELYKSHKCRIQKEKPTCQKCNIEFQNGTELMKHNLQLHPLVVSLLMCKYCQTNVVGTLALKKHFNRAHKHELHLYKYECKYCSDYIFKHPKKLFAHIFSKHREISPYLCKTCDKVFRVRKSFTLHIKLAHKSAGTVEYDDKYNVTFVAKEEGSVTDHDYVINKADKPADSVTNLGSNTEDKVLKATAKKKSTAASNEKADDEEYDVEYLDLDSDNDTAKENTIVKPMEKRLWSFSKRKLLEEKAKVTRKNTITKKKMHYSESSDEDQPLIKMGKGSKLHKATMNKYQRVINGSSAINFTCSVCNKYCYTFQNYNRHMSLHSKDDSKQCIKCGRLYKTSDELDDHLKKMHNRSRLTDTLKDILERKKKGLPKKSSENQNLSNSEKFKLSIKKVDIDTNSHCTSIREVPKGSVQNFLESFTPESNIEKNSRPVECNLSVTLLKEPVQRANVINLTKVNMDLDFTEFRHLAMPVKIKPQHIDTGKAQVKVITGYVQKTMKLNFGSNEEHDQGPQEQTDYNAEENYVTENDYIENDYAIDNDEDNMNYSQETQTEGTAIPEVAHEVFLEGSDEIPRLRITQKKIIIPQVPRGLEDVRVGQLMPDAPYYKIVKVDELLNQPETEPQIKQEPDLELPGGAKLVNVNPFAHLLQGKEINLSQNKYYKGKKYSKVDMKNVIAKALLDQTPTFKKRKRKGRQDVTATEEVLEVPLELPIEN